LFPAVADSVGLAAAGLTGVFFSVDLEAWAAASNSVIVGWIEGERKIQPLRVNTKNISAITIENLLILRIIGSNNI